MVSIHDQFLAGPRDDEIGRKIPFAPLIQHFPALFAK
jgi:hypothetical protein